MESYFSIVFLLLDSDFPFTSQIIYEARFSNVLAFKDVRLSQLLRDSNIYRFIQTLRSVGLT